MVNFIKEAVFPSFFSLLIYLYLETKDYFLNQKPMDAFQKVPQCPAKILYAYGCGGSIIVFLKSIISENKWNYIKEPLRKISGGMRIKLSLS